MQMKIIIILVAIFFSIAIAKPNKMTEKTIPYSTTIKADSSKLKKKTSDAILDVTGGMQLPEGFKFPF